MLKWLINKLAKNQQKTSHFESLKHPVKRIDCEAESPNDEGNSNAFSNKKDNNRVEILESIMKCVDGMVPSNINPGKLDGGEVYSDKSLSFENEGVKIQVNIDISCVDATSSEVSQSSVVQMSGLPSAEKIKLVQVVPMNIRNDDVIKSDNGTGKTYKIRVSPQKQGAFEFDKELSVVVTVKATSRVQAHNALSSYLFDDYERAFPMDPRNLTAESGRWYDGTRCLFEVLE